MREGNAVCACLAFSFSSFQSAVRQMMLFLATQLNSDGGKEGAGREGGGESNGCRSVGRSVGRLHSHSASRDSDGATAVSTLINIIKECASCVMHGGVDGVRGGRLVPLRNGMERGKREATAFFR